MPFCQFRICFKVKVITVVASCAFIGSKHPVPRVASHVLRAPTYRCKSTVYCTACKLLASHHGGWWEKHFSEIFPIRKHSADAAVLSQYDSKRARALSPVVASRVIIVINHFSSQRYATTFAGRGLIWFCPISIICWDWEAEVLRFLRFRSDTGLRWAFGRFFSGLGRGLPMG